MQLLRLQKTYSNGKKPLSDLSFGLKRGECFGFLGINGADKIKTMKIPTGNLLPTSGTAKLNGFDILTQRTRVRQSIGYSLQFDALLDLLTVREHLELYGRLKDFHAQFLEQEADRLLHKLQLKSFEGKLAGSLSGGNKRQQAATSGNCAPESEYSAAPICCFWMSRRQGWIRILVDSCGT
uniref:ABC transporter domain-containing protein n=1 Tax=Globisporangium ultimum (strain ATCC 200006 / CBS 805.95 / DAOM BR144) TaxID=431595 RepID=K3WGA4_GLOUD